MAVNEQSVATDLGALLRESLNDEVLVAKTSASIPVQIAATPTAPPVAAVPSHHPASGIQMAGSYQVPQTSIPPLGPQLSTLPTPMKPLRPLSLQPGVPVSPPKSSSGMIVGAFVAVALLAGAGGGGFAWYHAKHAAKVPVAAAVTAQPTSAALPPALVAAPTAEATTSPADPVAVAPTAEPPAPAEKAAEVAPDEAPAPAPAATHHHHAAPAAAPAPVVAAAPKPEPAPVAVAPKPDPKPAPAPAAPPPAAKPAGGVDALMQQQLSGAIP